MHDDLMALMERMLELNRRLKGTVGREREELERKIGRTDREIDELVYKLYGLTEEEIGMVEGWIMEIQRGGESRKGKSVPP